MEAAAEPPSVEAPISLPMSGSSPIAQPVEAAAAPPSSTGSSEREASQGSLVSASARSFARALALAGDLEGRAAAAGAGTRRRWQLRERKGGAKKAAAMS
ncbi:hypothetical protein E2562_017236 [Oryza meyeriana var. granulata]|uniref:Uncharacterized protein n=1 Tax=Oryza meyeriana var. granulata TaxID=110450 RepID=A0A6G1ELL7_9ORYZ|nr:hypothetical protein E2562_017236 [Oryza meyeriana var. granulata]